MHALLSPLLALSLGWVSPEVALSPTTREPSYDLRGSPAVASNGAVTLVAWQDDRPASGVYAARMLADGTVLDPTGILIGPGGAQPTVASNGSDFLIAWAGGSFGAVIFAQRLGADGALQGPVINVSPSGTFVSPAAAFDGTQYVVAWAEDFGGPVSAARVSSQGMVIDTTPIAIDSSGPPGNSDEHPLVASALVGTTLIAWENNSSACRVRARRLSATGQLVDSTALTLSANSGLGGYCQPSAASDGSGFAVAFNLDATAGSEVQLVRVPASGAPSAATVVGAGIADGVNLFTSAGVAASGGSWWVLWNDAGRQGVRLGRVDGSGARLDATPFKLGSGPLDTVVAATANAGALAVYGRIAPGSSLDLAVEAARIDSTPSIAQQIPVSRTATRQLNAAFAAGVDQGFVAWVDGPGITGRLRVLGTRVGRDGQPLDTPPIDVAPSVLHPWEVAAGFDGTNYVVAWDDSGNLDAGMNIYAVRVRPDGGLVDGAPIGLGTTTAQERYPQVASGAADAVVCWDVNDRQISCTALHPDGGTQPAFSRNTNASYGSRFGIGHSGNEWLVAWSDDGTIPSKLYAQRLSSSFAPVGGPRIVGPYGGVRVNSVSVSGNSGGYLMAYIQDASSSPRLRATRLSLDGGVLDVSVPPTLSSGDLASFGGLSTFSVGNDWAIIWSETRTGTGSDVLVQRLSDAGTFIDSSPVVIASTLDEEHTPTVGALGAALAVAYVREDTSMDQQQPRARLRLFSTLSAPGASCSTGDTCGSGACVQGLCCDRFCNGACTGGLCQDPIADAGTPVDGGTAADAGISEDAGTATDGGHSGAPVFLSAPPTSSHCAQGVDYQPVVDGAGPLLFSLAQAPEGMTVDSTTGRVRWTPSPTQQGMLDATLIVSGPQGYAQQSFTLEGACDVFRDDPPVHTCGCGAADGSIVFLSLLSLALSRRRARL